MVFNITVNDIKGTMTTLMSIHFYNYYNKKELTTETIHFVINWQSFVMKDKNNNISRA